MTTLTDELLSRPIRVLVANDPGVLAEIVTRLIGQEHDMVLVDRIEGQVETLSGAQAEVDVVVLSAPQIQPLPAIGSHLLSEYPDLRIVVLATSGDAAMLYWRGLRRRQLAPLSKHTLLANIRWAYALNPTA